MVMLPPKTEAPFHHLWNLPHYVYSLLFCFYSPSFASVASCKFATDSAFLMHSTGCWAKQVERDFLNHLSSDSEYFHSPLYLF